MRRTPLVTRFSTGFALVWLLTACGSAPTRPTPTNHPPAGGNVTVTPTAVGMAGVTSFAFDSNASDEDRDGLTYEWNFGDGGTGTGKTPTHIYTATGTFGVTLRVTDGKAAPVSATGLSVTVAPSITGTWTGGRHSFSNCGLSFAATQSGNTLTGFFTWTERCTGTVALASGSVNPLSHPSTVIWTSNVFFFDQTGVIYPAMTLRFTGTTDTAGSSVTGTLQTLFGPNVFSETTTFTR